MSENAVDTPTTLTGTIRMTNPERSFGFITGDDGHNYFFHKSSVQRTGVGTEAFFELATGDMVTFEAQASAKGPRATVVTKV
jgi:CspA family cold shock protein